MQWPLIVRNGCSQDGRMLHYVMNYSEKEQSVTCPYAQVEDLLTGTVYRQGDAITLHDWDLVILEELP
jgi:beta-galactosidase